MVVASSSQISLPVYPACRELRTEERRVCPVYAESRSERTRKALRALCVLCVKTHLQPRPALPAKSVSIPSSSDLCALCVSAFSSPNLSPFNPKLLALSTLRPEERNEGSPAEGSTFSRPSLRPLPAVDCKLSAASSRPSFPNSHRITSFAYPHPLTPIESYLCKKRGRGYPS